MSTQPKKGFAITELLLWIAGGAVGLISTVAVVYAQATSTAVSVLQSERTVDIQRVATIEAHYTDIDTRLTRIEDKIDKLSN